MGDLDDDLWDALEVDDAPPRPPADDSATSALMSALAAASPSPPADDGAPPPLPDGDAPPPLPDGDAPPPLPDAPPPMPDAPPPPDDKPPPPSLQAVAACQSCTTKLSSSSPPLSCGLCLSCRFTTGNPFRPGRLVAWGALKPGQTKVLEIPFSSIYDPRSGALPVGCVMEARCLRIDAPEWRYELTHSWPSGVSLFVDDQRVLKKSPDEDSKVGNRVLFLVLLGHTS